MTEYSKPRAYAVKHLNEQVRSASRSGGVFTALSDIVLKDGGAVYGCILTERFDAVHSRALNEEERDAMRGSKYVQSSLGTVYKQVKADLEQGKRVLFSGTSCQVAGLRGYLGKVYENLECVDIVCHGVPSPAVWREYLRWQEAKYGKCVEVDFRNKKDFGWAAHTETLTFEQDGALRRRHSKVYTRLFYSHNCLRPCCYECPYRSLNHPGDLTIADFWEIDKVYPGFNDDRGVSLVLVNGVKGERMLEAVKPQLEWKETDLMKSIRPTMLKPFSKPPEREQFWKDFEREPFERIAKRYGGEGFRARFKRKLKRILAETSLFA